MVKIQAFQAYLPSPEKVNEIACPPYDVVTEEEARDIVQRHPESFMKVLRPEVNLKPGSSDQQQHEEAAQQFQQLVSSGLLVKETHSAIYLYRQSSQNHVQVGLVAACSVDDYENNRVKKHEHVRPEKVTDRTNHFIGVKAQTGPVFLAYRPTQKIASLLESELENGNAIFDFQDESGIRHEVFRAEKGPDFIAAFEEVASVYIADGHHRTASACAVKQQKEAQDLSDASDSFLAVLFPENQLQILPYNRLVTDFGGSSAEQFLETLSQRIPVVESDGNLPDQKGVVAFYLGDRWRKMDLRVLWPELTARQNHPEKALDANLLQDYVLGPLLGVDDPRTNSRILFWGGHRGPAELEAAVNDGVAAVAFSMFPVTMKDLMDVSDAQQVMPPKSTWFEPKLRSGLFVYDLS
ncbi:MAG: DUF1015 family protein [Planctomycetota bacterium]